MAVRPASVSILIPAYNEAARIPGVVRGIRNALPEAEIIVCDDGSTDETAAVLATLDVRVVRHSRNRGYGAAWKSLAVASTREFLLYFDGDGQFDAADIQHLLTERSRSGADMVSGSRTAGAGSPRLRRPGKWVMKRFAIWLSGASIPDVNCGLRLVERTTFLRFLPLLPDGFSASTTSLLAYLAVGRDVAFLPIAVNHRPGKSSVRIVRDGFRSLMLIVRIASLFTPMRVFLPVATALLSIGMTYSLFVSLRVGLGIPVLGATLIINGIIVFFFGILADQVSALRLEHLRIGHRDTHDV